jgi:hypothetical protein
MNFVNFRAILDRVCHGNFTLEFEFALQQGRA